MGLQKFRSDFCGETANNGSIPWYSDWMGGPSLSKIDNCPVDDSEITRTVYIVSEPDTFFSIPAVCRIDNKTVKGFVYMCSDGNGYRFASNQ